MSEDCAYQYNYYNKDQLLICPQCGRRTLRWYRDSIYEYSECVGRVLMIDRHPCGYYERVRHRPFAGQGSPPVGDPLAEE